jgi:hypothetical protein
MAMEDRGASNGSAHADGPSSGHKRPGRKSESGFLPWFKFPVEDWLSLKYRECSIAARGLCADLFCLAHRNTRRGYLQTVSGKPFTLERVAKIADVSTEEVSRLLQELVDSAVLSVSAKGVHYFPDMVHEEQIRQARVRAGRLGGKRTGFLLKQNAKQNSSTFEGGGPAGSSSPSKSSSSLGDGARGRGPPGNGEEGNFADAVRAAMPPDCPEWYAAWSERHALRFGFRRPDDPRTLADWWHSLRRCSPQEIELEQASLVLQQQSTVIKGRNEHPRRLAGLIGNARREAAQRKEQAEAAASRQTREPQTNTPGMRLAETLGKDLGMPAEEKARPTSNGESRTMPSKETVERMLVEAKHSPQLVQQIMASYGKCLNGGHTEKQ